jgi:hypothetical protein
MGVALGIFLRKFLFNILPKNMFPITKDLFMLTMRSLSEEILLAFEREYFMFRTFGFLALGLCFSLTGSSAVAATNRRFSMVSDQPIGVPDASLGFANLFNETGFDLIDAQCQVFVNRPEHKTGVRQSDLENRVECSVAASERILLPIQIVKFGNSPVESWGSAEEASFVVRGEFAQSLWEKMHPAVWREFNGRIDASIYFPIVSCQYDEESSQLGACSEIYVIDRSIGTSKRSQVLCVRKSNIGADNAGGGFIEGYDPANPSLMQRKILSQAISVQLRKAERNVESYSCIFMD